MNKTQLTLALQKFPEVDLQVKIGDRILPLDHVEFSVDSTPQTVEPSNTADSWATLLAGRLKIMLVGTPTGDSLKAEDRK